MIPVQSVGLFGARCSVRGESRYEGADLFAKVPVCTSWLAPYLLLHVDLSALVFC